MKSPALNIIIGAASIAVAVWFLQKYFAENKLAAKQSLTADSLQDDREVTKDCKPGIFPDAMLLEMDVDEVDNWGNFSGRSPMQYKNQNPPEND